jgi:hypothetical protein
MEDSKRLSYQKIAYQALNRQKYGDVTFSLEQYLKLHDRFHIQEAVLPKATFTVRPR